MGFNNIPQQLKDLPNWNLWKLEEPEKEGEKPRKVPYQANGKKASSTDPNTWGTFEAVENEYNKGGYQGIGFMFGNSPYCGYDQDHCIIDGKLTPLANEVINELNSYTELSQSGTGIHVIVEGKKLGTSCKNTKTNQEIYDTDRGFWITGKRIEGTPPTIEKRQTELDNIYNKMFPENEKLKPVKLDKNSSIYLSASDIIDKAKKAVNGNKFSALYNGDISGYNNDHSSADQAFCNMIAFYTKDFNVIDTIFKSSGLYRNKWDRKDYKARTINKAINDSTGDYDENYNSGTIKPQSNNREEENPAPITKEEYLKNSASSHLQSFINGIAESVNTPCIPTGFNKLDGILDGGLYEGLYIVGAISSLGKTTFVLQIADQIARAGQDILIFSLEMARTELMAKSISRITLELSKDPRNAKTTRGITAGKRHLNYSQSEKSLINNSISAYGEYAKHIFIHEGMGEIGVKRINEEVNRHIELTGNKPIVIIDYLQLLAPYDPRSTDKQNTDKAVMELKRISRDNKIPILAISSFNRENYNAPVSMLSFKESGAIEYSSDVLIGLQWTAIKDQAQGEKLKIDHDSQKKKNPRAISLQILKNRNGATGDSIDYEYYPLFNLFREL